MGREVLMAVAMAGVMAVGLAEGTVWSTVSLKGAGWKTRERQHYPTGWEFYCMLDT